MTMRQSKTATPSNRYLYNGKELQEATGWMDYGARMYEPSLGRWFVVDPLADSSFNYTPYHYVANNPIIFVDPDGRDFLIWYENEDGERVEVPFRFNGSNGDEAPDNEFVQQFITAYNYNANNGGGEALQGIACNSSVAIGVTKTDEASVHYAGYIYWNSQAGSEYENGTIVSPATVLEHEADHALQRATNFDQFRSDKRTPDSNYTNLEEKRVITGREQNTARANGEIPSNGVTRRAHDGDLVITNGPTSTKINKNKTRAYNTL